jgi:phage terminase large subunit
MRLDWGAAYSKLWEPAENKCFKGGRGSQKSHCIAEYTVLRSARKKETIVGARQFQRSIRTSSKALIENKIIDLGMRRDFEVTNTEIRHRKTKSTFNFIGLERNPDNARSLEGCSICWVEEARNISKVSMNVLIPTVRAAGSEIVWSWNPVKASDPIEQYFCGEVRPPETVLVHTTYRDNPHFKTTRLPNQMEHMKKTNHKLYMHVWEGEYDDGGEARIFQNNITIKHMEIPDTLRPQFGMDFGSNNDPNVLLRFFVLKSIQTIYVTHERFLPSSTEKWMEHISDVPGVRDFTLVGDGAWPQTISTMNNNGFRVVAAKKGPGSVLEGIKWLQGWNIVIDPSCEKFANEARLYSWEVDPYDDKNILNIPCDTDNHGWDALRYGTEKNRDGTGEVTIRRL